MSRLSEFLWKTRHVSLAFVFSRLLIFGLMLLSRLIIPPGEFARPGGLLTLLTQWDSIWYLWIVRDGYFFHPGFESNVGFFPFYPLLVRGVFLVVRDLHLAGVLVSNVCLWGAAIALHGLVRLEYRDERVARTAVTFLLFSPVSFFFSSAYSESTFLLLAIGAFLAARQDRWLVACLCGMCLSATRNLGVTIAIPLLAEFAQQRWDATTRLRSLLDRRLFFFLLIPCGLLAFLLFLHFSLGNASAYFEATAHWGRRFAPPWQTLANARALKPFYQWLFGLVLLAACAATVLAALLRLRASYVIYSALLLAIYLCGNSLEGIPRYVSVVFPLFIVAALLSIRWPRLYEPLLAATTVLLALCTILYANGYWMT